MTSYEFEVGAKNAVLSVVNTRYKEAFTIQDLSVVWMAHILGYKKCVLVDNGNNSRLYEVTYNKGLGEFYVDVYEKAQNVLIAGRNIKTAAE